MNERPMVCAVCSKILNRMDGKWLHASELVGKSDHLCVPIEWTDEVLVTTMCDFCQAETVEVATFTVPARDFTVPIVNGRSLGAWAACADCAPLVEAEQWDDVAVRAYANMEAKGQGGEHVRIYLKLLYEALAAHRDGPVRPFKPGDESA